jgi:hypothetical protein
MNILLQRLLERMFRTIALARLDKLVACYYLVHAQHS